MAERVRLVIGIPDGLRCYLLHKSADIRYKSGQTSPLIEGWTGEHTGIVRSTDKRCRLHESVDT